jgi:HSP20 family molecular chaperone IbpA
VGDAESGVWYAMTLSIGSDPERRTDGHWDPPLEMNRWLSPDLAELGAGDSADRRVVNPPVEVLISDEGMILVADMPGIPRDNIDVRVMARLVEIVGVPPGDERRGTLLAPEQAGRGHASGRMPDIASAPSFEGPCALLRGGVLELRLPKGALLRGDDQGRITVR